VTEGIQGLVFMTASFWTKDNSRRLDIVGRSRAYASRFEKAPPQQTVYMRWLAYSRSLIWLPIPGGLFLSKICQAVNTSPVVVLSVHGMQITPKWYKRLLVSGASLLRFVFCVAVAREPYEPASYVIVAFAFGVLSHVLELALPDGAVPAPFVGKKETVPLTADTPAPAATEADVQKKEQPKSLGEAGSSSNKDGEAAAAPADTPAS